jgi:hypothetical protein
MRGICAQTMRPHSSFLSPTKSSEPHQRRSRADDGPSLSGWFRQLRLQKFGEFVIAGAEDLGCTCAVSVLRDSGVRAAGHHHDRTGYTLAPGVRDEIAAGLVAELMIRHDGIDTRAIQFRGRLVGGRAHDECALGKRFSQTALREEPAVCVVIDQHDGYRHGKKRCIRTTTVKCDYSATQLEFGNASQVALTDCKELLTPRAGKPCENRPELAPHKKVTRI